MKPPQNLESIQSINEIDEYFDLYSQEHEI